MRLSLKQDILLNIALPVLAGCCLYYIFFHATITGFWRNQLPDGLWAYALFSSLLIIWNRCINIFWIIVILMAFIAFETLQYLHFINGTGDLWDIVVYFLFSIISLLTNNFIISSTKQMKHDKPF